MGLIKVSSRFVNNISNKGAPLAGRVMDLAGSTASGLGVVVCGAIMTGSASVYAIATCSRLRAERRRGYEEI